MIELKEVNVEGEKGGLEDTWEEAVGGLTAENVMLRF